MSLTSDALRRRRGRRAVSYAAVVLENGLELLFPFVIGVAVNDLLEDRWHGAVAFAVITIASIVVAVARQTFDTRSFNRLYEDLASELVERQREHGIAVSSIAARTKLASEFVDFLETDVGEAIAAGFALVGSALMLFTYDTLLGAAAVLFALPVALINRRLFHRSRRIYESLNDQSEREVSIIELAPRAAVRRHFRIVGSHWIRLSDSEATSWGVVSILALGLSLLALVRTTSNVSDVGAIFAALAYVWTYTGGFDLAPYVLQRISNLGDIKRRLDGHADLTEHDESTA